MLIEFIRYKKFVLFICIKIIYGELIVYEKQQNLGLSNCQNKLTNYCNTHVQDSVCNWAKNECFCRLGFVAIRENDEIVCRTLLTNLPCRMDSHCIHVDKSVCHPGAGKCVCPGHKIYVPHLHACRSKLYVDRIPECGICEPDGICHEVLNTDLPRFEKIYALTKSFAYSHERSHARNVFNVGCACSPVNSSPTMTTLQIKQIITSTNHTYESKKDHKQYCPIHLPDIGEPCNPSINLCRSMLAICNPVKSMSDQHICQCPTNMVGIFQNYLNYFECFPIIEKNQKNSSIPNECQTCINHKGICYDQNEDGLGDGCQCPPDKSHLHTNNYFGLNRNFNTPEYKLVNRLRENQTICGRKHIISSCNKDSVGVCYSLHNFNEFKFLPLKIRLNEVQIRTTLKQDSFSISNQTLCTLQFKPNLTHEIVRNSVSQAEINLVGHELWHCTQIAYKDLKLCEIQVHQDRGCINKKSNEIINYFGNVFLQTNQIRKPNRLILKIPWKCTVHSVCQSKSFEQTKSQSSLNLRAELQILNNENQYVEEVVESEKIYLKLYTQNENLILCPQSCMITSTSLREHVQAANDTYSIIKQLFCHFNSHENIVSGLNNQKVFVLNIKSKNQSNQYYETNLLPIIRSNPNMDYIKFICFISYITDLVNQCSNNRFVQKFCNQSDQSTQTVEDQYFVTANLKINKHFSQKLNCQSISCLTLSQLGIICFILLVVDIFVCALLILAYKRKQIQTNNNIKTSEQFCINSFSESSKLNNKLQENNFEPNINQKDIITYLLPGGDYNLFKESDRNGEYCDLHSLFKLPLENTGFYRLDSPNPTEPDLSQTIHSDQFIIYNSIPDQFMDNIHI